MHNPEYTTIIQYIMHGTDAPNKILRKINKKKKVHCDGETLSNLSMKTRYLRDHELISTRRLRSINRSSTSRHFINFVGFVKLAIKTFIPSLLKEEKNFLKTVYMRRLAALMQNYLDKVFHLKGHEHLTIHGILQDWIKGIGLSVYRTKEEIKTRQNLNDNTVPKQLLTDIEDIHEWSSSVAFRLDCMFYFLQSNTNGYMISSSYLFEEYKF